MFLGMKLNALGSEDEEKLQKPVGDIFTSVLFLCFEKIVRDNTVLYNYISELEDKINKK